MCALHRYFSCALPCKHLPCHLSILPHKPFLEFTLGMALLKFRESSNPASIKSTLSRFVREWHQTFSVAARTWNQCCGKLVGQVKPEKAVWSSISPYSCPLWCTARILPCRNLGGKCRGASRDLVGGRLFLGLGFGIKWWTGTDLSRKLCQGERYEGSEGSNERGRNCKDEKGKQIPTWTQSNRGGWNDLDVDDNHLCSALDEPLLHHLLPAPGHLASSCNNR